MAVPVAATLKEAFPPAHAEVFTTLVVIRDASFTVRIAGADVIDEGQVLLTITWYLLLFITGVTPVKVSEEPVAPVIFV